MIRYSLRITRYTFQWHELHEDELHEEQPETEEVCFSTPLIPKRENFFLMFFELHVGQAIAGFEPETSFSNSFPQPSHVYSKIGIFCLR